MKLLIRIHRQRETETDPGTLRAVVVETSLDRNGVQVAREGEDLLRGRRFTVVDSAVSAIDRHIMRTFKLVDPPEIVYQVEDDQPAPEILGGLRKGDRVLYTPRCKTACSLRGSVKYFTRKGRVAVHCDQKGDGSRLTNPIQVVTKPACLEKL